MHKDSVAIIIVNWNSFKDTIECFKSLINLEYDNFKIYIVDNGSENDSVCKIREYLKNYECNYMFIESDSNLGFAGGNNLGIKQAIKDGFLWFWLLNNDTIADKNSLKSLVDYGVKHNNAGILGSKIYYYGTKIIWFAGGLIDYSTGKGFSVGRNQEDIGQFDKVKSYDYITGCSLLIKKEVIDSVGLMEDGFFLYYEETDWNLRARKKGWECFYIPESIIEHKVGASTEGGYSNPFISYYNLRNRYIMTRRNKSYFTRFGALFFLLKMTIALIYFAITKRDKKVERIKYAVCGCFDGIRNKLGKFK